MEGVGHEPFEMERSLFAFGLNGFWKSVFLVCFLGVLLCFKHPGDRLCSAVWQNEAISDFMEH